MDMSNVTKLMGQRDEDKRRDMTLWPQITNKPFIAANHKIDKVKHKAIIEVDEHGKEASLGAVTRVYPQPQFAADHPFMFAICNSQGVLLAGHVVKF